MRGRGPSNIDSFPRLHPFVCEKWIALFRRQGEQGRNLYFVSKNRRSDMADLIVTFTKISAPSPLYSDPLEIGSMARCEAINIGADSACSTLAAAAGEDIISLLANADCWIAIGAKPRAAAVVAGAIGVGRKLLSGTDSQFAVSIGDKIAVVQA